jgi:hypothetical protein
MLLLFLVKPVPFEIFFKCSNYFLSFVFLRLFSAYGTILSFVILACIFVTVRLFLSFVSLLIVSPRSFPLFLLIDFLCVKEA